MERKIDRFLEYLSIKGISENRATAECSLSQGLLYRAKTGKADIGNKAVEKILSTYPDLNRVWLLTGTGSMLNDSPVSLPDPEPVASGSPSLERLLVMLEETQRMNAMLLGMVKEKDIIIKDLTAEILKIKSKGADAENVIGSFAADAV